MNRASQILPLAFLVASVTAQTSTVVIDPNDPGTTTVYYSTCPSVAETTITLASTLTYCPGNNCGGGPVITPAPGAGGTVPDGPLGTEIIDYTTTGTDGKTTHYQAFETVYSQACPTCPGGLAAQTFTVTEECPCMSARPSTYMPSGFDTTVYTCDACAKAGSPMTLTITSPCATGPYANQATATGWAGATSAGTTRTGTTVAGSANTGMAGTEAGAYGVGATGLGTTVTGYTPSIAGPTANQQEPSNAATTSPGMGGPGSSITTSPQTTPAASGSSTGSGAYFKGAASHAGTALSAVLAVVGGLLAWAM